tara:strand:- start:52 stop:513 length:462 start_codon:yes stop_codon:yes gene_type:complete
MINLNTFNEETVDWQPLPGPDGSAADHIGMSILNIDDNAKIVDVLFKFAANEKILWHKHTSDFNTFVVKGEHRIYSLDGELREVRPAGTFKATQASEDPHTEGGGDEDVVILFSLRPYDDERPIYEILDEDHEVVAEMTFNAMKDIYLATEKH